MDDARMREIVDELGSAQAEYNACIRWQANAPPHTHSGCERCEAADMLRRARERLYAANDALTLQIEDDLRAKGEL